MARFTLQFDPGFFQDLKRISRSGRREVVERIYKALVLLEEDPTRPRTGLDVRPLRGSEGQSFRLRVGRYRVLYAVDFQTRKVTVSTAYHRKHGYKE